MGQNKYVSGGYLSESTGQAILAALGGNLTADQLVIHDYAATSVDLVYVAIGVATTKAIIKLDIFDSSGEPMILGIDPAGGVAFVDSYLIAPGGNGVVELNIATIGSTLAVKRQAVTGGLAATSGFLEMTLLG